MDTIVGSGGATDAKAPADIIKDSDTARFGRDVIEASMAAPVIVDFWAPWCGPCKQLGPLLEKAVQGARGALRLVKINVDQNQALAGQLRIQSIPAVYAFYQGQPVDGFVGAQGESQIKSFVERLVRQAGGAPGPSPVEQALEQAKAALEAKQFGAASALFGQVLQHEPENEDALAGMIRCHLDSGDAAGARTMFDSLSAELKGKPALESVAAAIELAEAGAQAGPIPELRERLAASPGDHQIRFDLAMALHAAGERESAADELLEIVRRNRTWNEEAARKQLVKLFEAWGPADPLTLEARRRLSSLLFA
ncbi:MAG: tetratricopeptide repeat protein [Kiloniellaceae bacterium]